MVSPPALAPPASPPARGRAEVVVAERAGSTSFAGDGAACAASVGDDGPSAASFRDAAAPATGASSGADAPPLEASLTTGAACASGIGSVFSRACAGLSSVGAAEGPSVDAGGVLKDLRAGFCLCGRTGEKLRGCEGIGFSSPSRGPAGGVDAERRGKAERLSGSWDPGVGLFVLSSILLMHRSQRGKRNLRRVREPRCYPFTPPMVKPLVRYF